MSQRTNNMTQKTLQAVHNNKRTAELAREIAFKQFDRNVDIQALFSPLMEEIRGLGRVAASEIAWELFVWLELDETVPLGGQK